MTSPLSAEQIEGLRRYNTPTISNAIEVFNVRPRHSGSCRIRSAACCPDLGADRRLCGDLADPRRASPRTTPPDLNADYSATWPRQPGPKIAVGQDLDDPPGLGAQFGEVNATIHKKLGCVGHITDGCPRDLDEVRALGFGLFGLNPCVSHAYVRLVDFGKPVTLAGVEIRPGDLIHADKHGVCIIPHEIAAEARRGLRRGRADGAAAAGDLPVRRLLARGIPRPAGRP